MLLSPYQTTTLKGKHLDEIITKVKKAHINGLLYPQGDGFYLITPETTDIPILTQPLTAVELKHPELLVVSDARTYLKAKGETWEIRNQNEYDFETRRAKLQIAWMKSLDKTSFYDVGELAPVTFVNWVSRAIVGKLSLDYQQQIELMILSGFYYYCLFHNQSDFDRSDLHDRLAVKIANLLKISPALTSEVINNISYINDLVSFAEAIKIVVDSNKTDNIQVIFVYNALLGSWFGNNSKEIVAVALEHPPTYLAMLQSAIELNSYKNAGIGKLVKTLIKRDNDLFLLRSLNLLTKGYPS